MTRPSDAAIATAFWHESILGSATDYHFRVIERAEAIDAEAKDVAGEINGWTLHSPNGKCYESDTPLGCIFELYPILK